MTFPSPDSRRRVIPLYEMAYDYRNYWINKTDRYKYYSNLYNHIKKFLTPPNESLDILDVGGGDGSFLVYLDIKRATILDISDTGIEIAKKFGYYTIKGDILKPFALADDSFDIIYCFEVLEHIYNPRNTFLEIYRVLKPHGIAIFMIPNIWREKLDEHHVKHWKYKELINTLKEYKFKKIDTYKCPRLKDTRWRTLTKLAAQIFPDIFSSFFVIKVTKNLSDRP